MSSRGVRSDPHLTSKTSTLIQYGGRDPIAAERKQWDRGDAYSPLSANSRPLSGVGSGTRP